MGTLPPILGTTFVILFLFPCYIYMLHLLAFYGFSNIKSMQRSNSRSIKDDLPACFIMRAYTPMDNMTKEIIWGGQGIEKYFYTHTVSKSFTNKAEWMKSRHTSNIRDGKKASLCSYLSREWLWGSPQRKERLRGSEGLRKAAQVEGKVVSSNRSQV